jgi:predicted dienelactone hydrolase
MFRDAARNNKVVAIALYYPAVAAESAGDGKVIQNAAPDVSGAPYPVVLAAGKEATYFGVHLASYGVVFAGLEPQDNSPSWWLWLIDYPRDVIFALDQMAAGQLDGFAGILDPEHAGVLGYSFDSNPPLQMSGARMDPAFYLAQCAATASGQSTLWASWVAAWGICARADKWDEFAAVAGASITRSGDGLWQPLADPRVRAVMPMAPDFYWLFGERGLAAVDRPMLILANSDDVDSPYSLAVETLQHLPEQYGAMITFVGKDHGIIFDPADGDRMRHFVTAFFGYHLLGCGEYAHYFSSEFVAQQAGLAWGVYQGE